MIKQIRDCQKCGLCINQKPLLDTEKQCQVFWVGLSAKKAITNTEIPLSPETNTGMVIQKIENSCCNVVTYKTNLVKCLPLTEQPFMLPLILFPTFGPWTMSCDDMQSEL